MSQWWDNLFTLCHSSAIKKAWWKVCCFLKRLVTPECSLTDLNLKHHLLHDDMDQKTNATNVSSSLHDRRQFKETRRKTPLRKAGLLTPRHPPGLAPAPHCCCWSFWRLLLAPPLSSSSSCSPNLLRRLYCHTWKTRTRTWGGPDGTPQLDWLT